MQSPSCAGSKGLHGCTFPDMLPIRRSSAFGMGRVKVQLVCTVWELRADCGEIKWLVLAQI